QGTSHLGRADTAMTTTGGAAHPAGARSVSEGFAHQRPLERMPQVAGACADVEEVESPFEVGALDDAVGGGDGDIGTGPPNLGQELEARVETVVADQTQARHAPHLGRVEHHDPSGPVAAEVQGRHVDGLTVAGWRALSMR